MSYNPYAGNTNNQGGFVSAPPPRYSNNEGYVHEGAGGGDFGRLGAGSVDQGHGGYYPPVTGASSGQSSLPPPTGSLSGDPGVGVAEKRFDYNTPYRDVFFAILFVIHLIFVFIIAGYYGPRVSLSVNSDDNSAGGTGTTNDSKPFDGRRALGILIVSAIIGGVWSALWLEVMKKYANKIIMITLVLNGLLVFTAMIIAFATGAIGAGVGYLIIFAFACLYLYCVRHRIPFAHAVLHASALSLQKYSGPIYLTYFIAAISIGWFALWSYSFASLYMYGTEKGGKLTGGQQFLIVFLILSLYWTGQVLKNIGHTTTAGVVATFYFQPQIADATVPALKRSVTTSFGSICLGSLIVAAIRTVRVLLRSTRDRCADVVDCLLGMVERAVNYFNVYAYTMIAIYGYSFKESASQTMALFKARLFDALINDDLTGMVLLMGAFTAGAVAGIVAILWGAATKYDNWAGVAVLGFLVAFIIALLFMTVVESAVITTFVSWAMDPAVLSRNHPELYQNLESAAAAAGYQFKINTNAQAGPAIV